MSDIKHPIENLMMTAMTSLESMVDVNTIVGDMVTSPDGTVIIPVSKVCFGFAAGGSEFNTNKLNKFSENAKLPFGGGSGAGESVRYRPCVYFQARHRGQLQGDRNAVRLSAGTVRWHYAVELYGQQPELVTDHGTEQHPEHSQ